MNYTAVIFRHFLVRAVKYLVKKQEHRKVQENRTVYNPVPWTACNHMYT